MSAPATQVTLDKALALHAEECSSEAVTVLRSALSEDGGNARLLGTMGNILRENGDLAGAEHCYRQALENDASCFPARLNLGLVAEEAGDLAAAIEHYTTAAGLRPDAPEAHLNLGNAYFADEKLDQAEQAYRRAADLKPDWLEVQIALAHLYERTHRLAYARQRCDKALAIDSAAPAAKRLAAVLLRRQDKPEEALAMLEPIDPDVLPKHQARDLHFELGRLYEKTNHCDQAYQHFAKGNDLCREVAENERRGRFDFMAMAGNLETSLTPERLSALPRFEIGDGLPSPAFIIGFPRSGTTLIDQILDSHPRIQVLEEANTLKYVIQALEASPLDYTPAVTALTPEKTRMLRELYYRAVNEKIDRKPGRLFVDKNPTHMVHAALIHTLFPGAKFIFANRHPCDVVLSCFMQNFNPTAPLGGLTSLAEAADCYALSDRLWTRFFQSLPLDVHSVVYEQLVVEFDEQTAALLAFLNQPWDEQVRDYARRAAGRRIKTPSYEQVTRELYLHARGRWRKYASYLEPVLDRLAPAARQYGYSL